MSRAKGFPFNPSFLATLSDEQHTNSLQSSSASRNKRKRKASQLPSESHSQPIEPKGLAHSDPYSPPNEIITAEKYTVLTSSVDTNRKLLICAGIDVLYFSGFGSLTVLKGKVTVNGYNLVKSQLVRVSSPPWQPALLIDVKCSISNQNILSVLKKCNLNGEFAVSDAIIDMFKCDVVILLVCGSRDLEWMEAAEDMSKFKDPSSVVPSNVITVLCDTCAVFNKAGILANNLDYMILPPSWPLALSEVIAVNDSPRLPICGAKGSGKSTFMRYAINSLLNFVPSVCVLDCDLGQPEFTLPGVVSLSVVDSPVLQTSYMNVSKQTIECFFVGDITSKTNPDLLFNCIEKLMKTYHKYVHERSIAFESEARKNNSNTYLVLEDAGPPRIPLVINCDGNVRFFGEEVLKVIMDIVKPTFVAHIVTAKDPRLTAIDTLPPSCTVLRIEPGQTLPSRINATDLRTLRFIAYFLRESTDMTSVEITNGSIKDLSGRLAIEMASLPVYEIPFSRVSFRILSEHVIPRLTLSAFNLSVVGITPGPAQSASLSMFNDPTSSSSFVLDCTGSEVMEPCIGIGIVRAIDPKREVLYLASPAVIDSERVSLLKGSLQVPTLLYYSLHLPSHPYVTNETFGEGSDALKTRNNVKRRSQQR